jgi:hypothetical protein
MRFNYYLIAHNLPLDPTPLPEPKVVASITVDPAFIGKLNPHEHLKALAGKMGLLDFTIESAEAQDRPGYQLGLPFPRPRKKH